MSPALTAIDPVYVRLSGEIADQAVLDGLKHAFPRARIGHAYASTEAGVGFEVNDGLEGFSANLLGSATGVDIRVEDGSLRLRSARTAARYVGSADVSLADDDGFVDTGDMVERRGDRFYFVGRRGGIVNVGGLKVHPEEVEAVLNRHPGVQIARVEGRKNPITGAIVVASVVQRPDSGASTNVLRADLLDLCRQSLPAHKVPAVITFVPALAVTPAGKLVRSNA
jgi:acyl-coenzyme A synthetase/AMP-(fatty) acid ligase